MSEATEKKKRILVVDDEPEICDCLREIFEGAGMQVDVATTAAQALEYYGKNSYDLLTLDCFMPDTSGIALHQTLSKVYGFGKRLPSTMPQRLPPVLVITGYAHEPTVRDLAFGERVVGVLQKPIRSRALLRVVSDVLEWEEARSSRRQKALTRLKERTSRKGEEVGDKK